MIFSTARFTDTDKYFKSFVVLRFIAVKELWSPVYIDSKILSDNFNGSIEVENRYLYTNLDKCSFEWKTVLFTKANESPTKEKIVQKGVLKPPSLAPGKTGIRSIPSFTDKTADAFYLTAYDKKGDTICTWSCPLKTPAEIAKASLVVANVANIATKDQGQSLSVSCDGIKYYFDKTTGFLQKVFNGKKEVSLGEGPALAGSEQRLNQFKSYKQGNEYIAEPSYKGDSLKVKWIFQTGKLPKLEYEYLTKDTCDYMVITFNYPEAKINGMKWMGRGPYRVWKNRLKGQQFGVWQKTYNNTVTGQSWNYPEFKGWHSQLY